MKWQLLASTHYLSPPVKSGYTLSSCIQFHLKVSLIIAPHMHTNTGCTRSDQYTSILNIWFFFFFSCSPLLQQVDMHAAVMPTQSSYFSSSRSKLNKVLLCLTSRNTSSLKWYALKRAKHDIQYQYQGIISKWHFQYCDNTCVHTHTHTKTHKQLCRVDISNLIGVREFFRTASEHVALIVTHPVPCRSTDNCKYRHSLHFVWRGACEINLQTLRITSIYIPWHCHMCTGGYCGYRACPDKSCLWNSASHLPEPPSLCCCCQTLWWSSL